MNLFMIFSKWFTSTIGKFWLFSMKFMHTFVSSQQKFVNGFIHFKLIVSNVIKIVECCLIEFLIFNESGFFCHKQQKLIKVLIFFFFSFSNIWISRYLYFSCNWRNNFPLLLYNIFHRTFRTFYFSFDFNKFSQHIIYWNKFVFTNIWVNKLRL